MKNENKFSPNEYSKIEKRMFNLKEDGKMDTPEYFELIKQRAKLEKMINHFKLDLQKEVDGLTSNGITKINKP